MARFYYLALLGACLVVSVVADSSPASPSAQKPKDDKSNVLQKRDYKEPGVQQNIPAPAQSYGAPAQSYDAPLNEPDNGLYYYYYPVEEHGQGQGGKLKHGGDSCGIDKLLYPLILITVFLGVLAGNAIGLLPAITLPAITLPAKKPKSFDGRQLADFASDYVPWGVLERLTTSVMEAVESEECVSRLVCESGRYAEGRQTFLSLLEFFTPSKYQHRIKIFRDSAMKQTNCSDYKCSYAENTL